MKVIKEYLLAQTVGPQTLYLPELAKPIKVCSSETGLVLYAVVDSTQTSTALRKFQIFECEDIIYEDDLIYVDSYINDYGTTNFVFEIN